MITDDNENWHYLTAKSISKLLRGITSNNHRDFHCLNCFHLYSTENKLQKNEKVYKDYDYCHVKMQDKDKKY